MVAKFTTSPLDSRSVKMLLAISSSNATQVAEVKAFLESADADAVRDAAESTNSATRAKQYRPPQLLHLRCFRTTYTPTALLMVPELSA